MKENMKDENVIDVRKIIAKIWHKRKLFAKVLPVVFLVSCIYIVFIPRYYVCSVMLAPETENPVSGGMLSSFSFFFWGKFKFRNVDRCYIPVAVSGFDGLYGFCG